MVQALRVLMIRAHPGDPQRIEQLLVEAGETGRLPVLQVEFETGPDAAAAPAVLAQGPLDAIFLTLAAPEDLRTLAELHQCYPDLPIIVGVAAAEESLALLALTHGAAEYWRIDACGVRDMAAIFRHVLVKGQEKSYRQRLHWLEENLSEVVWRARPDLRWVETTASIQRLAGFSVEEALGMSLPDFIAPASRPALMAALLTTPLYKTGEPAAREITLELEHIHKDSHNFWVDLVLRVETGSTGQVLGLQGLTRDVTERHAIQERLDFISLHDPLTGLFNRNYLEEEIVRLEYSRHYPVTILMADFEGLREINAEHGVTAGDEMLRRVANLLRTAFRAEDMISRMSGSEFVVTMPHTHPRAAGRALQRVLNLVNAYNQGDPELPLTITMEVVTAEQGQSLMAAFKAAVAQKSNKKVAS